MLEIINSTLEPRIRNGVVPELPADSTPAENPENSEHVPMDDNNAPVLLDTSAEEHLSTKASNENKQPETNTSTENQSASVSNDVQLVGMDEDMSIEPTPASPATSVRKPRLIDMDEDDEDQILPLEDTPLPDRAANTASCVQGGWQPHSGPLDGETTDISGMPLSGDPAYALKAEVTDISGKSSVLKGNPSNISRAPK